MKKSEIGRNETPWVDRVKVSEIKEILRGVDEEEFRRLMLCDPIMEEKENDFVEEKNKDSEKKYYVQNRRRRGVD
jgi:pyridoxal/pyridoxine/pyridoxamine kinase